MCTRFLYLGVSIACLVAIDVSEKILTHGIGPSQEHSQLGHGAGTYGSWREPHNFFWWGGCHSGWCVTWWLMSSPAPLLWFLVLLCAVEVTFSFSSSFFFFRLCWGVSDEPCWPCPWRWWRQTIYTFPVWLARVPPWPGTTGRSIMEELLEKGPLAPEVKNTSGCYFPHVPGNKLTNPEHEAGSAVYDSCH